jgi:hypothetical protein
MGNVCCKNDADHYGDGKAKDHFTPMGNLNENPEDHLPKHDVAYLDSSAQATSSLNNSSGNIIRIANIDPHEYESQYHKSHGPYKYSPSPFHSNPIDTITMMKTQAYPVHYTVVIS